MHAEDHECQSLIRVNCPRLTVPAKTLGDDRQLALEVAPGAMHLWVELKSQGDKLVGEVVLKRSRVTLGTIVAHEYQCSEIASVFANAAQQIDRIEARVDVSGTLDRPSWVIQSNLGSELSRNLQSVITESLVVKQDQKLRSLHAETDQRIATMIQQLHSKRSAIIDLLAAGNKELGQVRESIASRAALTDGLVEPTSPLRETL